MMRRDPRTALVAQHVRGGAPCSSVQGRRSRHRGRFDHPRPVRLDSECPHGPVVGVDQSPAGERPVRVDELALGVQTGVQGVHDEVTTSLMGDVQNDRLRKRRQPCDLVTVAAAPLQHRATRAERWRCLPGPALTLDGTGERHHTSGPLPPIPLEPLHGPPPPVHPRFFAQYATQDHHCPGAAEGSRSLTSRKPMTATSAGASVKLGFMDAVVREAPASADAG